MPKINRVRIVNFSYNNNNRHIIDETFDFYGGENALLSLVNGGGKSVLVQIMLQPILPKISLQKREIKDFFLGKKAPSYIMIEWKLDDGAGYLLTGIGITSKISNSMNEDEQNLDIRYFTFLNAYDKANSFDIKDIPVTELLGRNIKIALYNEFKKLLEKEADKNKHDLHIFNSTREEQNIYEKKLSSYSISRDEWKELMVKINEAEHGVSEVFTKCKTSKMVMEQWIIKYIEKVLNKSSDSDASDHKKLEKMMSQVAWSLVDNENHIKEYQVIEGFNNDLKEIDEQTKSVLGHLDQEIQLKKKLGNGYNVLKAERQCLNQEYQETEEYITQLNSELAGIDLEEKSAEIYQYQEEIDNISAKLAALEFEKIEIDDQISKNSHQLNIQSAAEKHQMIQDKERKIADLKQRLENASKNQEQLMKGLNKVKYTLKIEYEKIISNQAQLIAKLQSDEESNKEQIETYILTMKSHQNELNRLNQSLGGVNKDIGNFEKEESTILQQLDLKIYRNPLLKELDAKEIQNSNKAINQKLETIAKSIENQSNEIQRLIEFINNQEQEINNINQKKIICHGEQVSNQNKITRYEDDRDKVINVLKMHNISEDIEIRLATLISKVESEIKDIMYIKIDGELGSFDEVETEIEPMLNQFSSVKLDVNKQIEAFRKKNGALNIKYQQIDVGTVIEALKGIQIQIEALDRTYDKYYYLTERIDYYFIQLSQILKIMEQKMLQLQHSQTDLVEHAFLEAMRIYHEIPKISENSSVEIEGARKRVLEIHYEEIQNELQAKEKMKIYIQECLESLKKSIKESEDENKVRRDLEKYISTKELLNVISSLEHCVVKAYKVDLNERNRKMMSWEEVIIKNSGGEKFVAYFSLLVALISYSRKHLRGMDIFKKKEESKVLIMDNPFGPITSGHLLKPMFDIAEKYNTQLICLSDIKQGSVVNSFDLVYMIKIRQNMAREDFLELEPLILADLTKDEKLEKAYLYTNFEQTKLFD